jgi:hypothetical protein
MEMAMARIDTHEAMKQLGMSTEDIEWRLRARRELVAGDIIKGFKNYERTTKDERDRNWERDHPDGILMVVVRNNRDALLKDWTADFTMKELFSDRTFELNIVYEYEKVGHIDGFVP